MRASTVLLLVLCILAGMQELAALPISGSQVEAYAEQYKREAFWLKLGKQTLTGVAGISAAAALYVIYQKLNAPVLSAPFDVKLYEEAKAAQKSRLVWFKDVVVDYVPHLVATTASSMFSSLCARPLLSMLLQKRTAAWFADTRTQLSDDLNEWIEREKTVFIPHHDEYLKILIGSITRDIEMLLGYMNYISALIVDDANKRRAEIIIERIQLIAKEMEIGAHADDITLFRKNLFEAIHIFSVLESRDNKKVMSRQSA
jgi:hypothetical protein